MILFLCKWLEKIHEHSGNALSNFKQQLYFMDYEDRDSDIYVVTFVKSGTTWMQVILYNLLTDGNMNFDHIYDVSPWPKYESANNGSPEKVNSLPSPRILKTHDKYDFFNADNRGKFIYVYREGKDVAVSLYHHNKNYRDPSLTFDKNFEDYYVTPDPLINWFEFTNAWLENKNNFNILYVSYEQLKNNFDATVRKIADFVEVELTDEIMGRVKKHSSFEYMKQHEEKFGEKPPVQAQLVYNEFIRKGQTGEGNEYLNTEQKKLYDEKFNHLIQLYLNKIQ